VQICHLGLLSKAATLLPGAEGSPLTDSMAIGLRGLLLPSLESDFMRKQQSKQACAIKASMSLMDLINFMLEFLS
jgi:hypothetical protein